MINQHNKTIITKNFSAKANLYSNNSPIQLLSSQKLINYLSQNSLINFNSKHNITALDIGSGSSFIAQNLFNFYNNIHLYEIDLCQSMLDNYTSISNIITKICGDIENIDFANESFDLIFSCFSLQWIDDPQKLFIKIQKILKNSGFFIGCFPTNKSFQNMKNIPIKIKNLPDKDSCYKILNNTKLKEVLVENIQISKSYDNVINALKSFKSNGSNYSNTNFNNFKNLKKFYLNNFKNNVNFEIDWHITYFIYKK